MLKSPYYLRILCLKVLLQDCVIGALVDKIVILVTHQVEFIPLVDTILVFMHNPPLFHQYL